MCIFNFLILLCPWVKSLASSVIQVFGLYLHLPVRDLMLTETVLRMATYLLTCYARSHGVLMKQTFAKDEWVHSVKYIFCSKQSYWFKYQVIILKSINSLRDKNYKALRMADVADRKNTSTVTGSHLLKGTDYQVSSL